MALEDLYLIMVIGILDNGTKVVSMGKEYYKNKMEVY